ncbi:MAG: hypothetical protein R3182_06360 [Draconibacterium sp.]|nr:hypothetical protein [Draconibacterium sp.]
MSQYQVKYLDEDDWKKIAEKDVLVKLVDEFGRVTPFLTQMLQGKEIITPDGIFRMKNGVNDGKGFFHLD